LFLMPSGTGTVLHWRKFVELLRSNRPICGIYMAGEGDYDQVTALEELAMQCARSIAQAYPGVPCHLCGYSFGGLLAFEVARQLQILGCEVGIVAILDTGPNPPITERFSTMFWHSPHILRNLLSRTCNAVAGGQCRRELRALVSKYKLARRTMAAGRSDVEQQEAIAFEYMFGKIQIPDKFRRVLSWTLKLQNSYRPQPYRGDLLLVRATKRPLFGPFEHDLGWGPYVGGRIVVANFQGDHGRMIAQAQLLKVAELLTGSFEEFESPSASAVLQHPD
jgi:thioesterase domain-containing protein